MKKGEETVKYPHVCEYCGRTFMATPSRKAKYCSRRCADNARYPKKKNKVVTDKTAERIAHQQDTTIWTHDYAERQKAKTLAMLGGIKV